MFFSLNATTSLFSESHCFAASLETPRPLNHALLQGTPTARCLCPSNVHLSSDCWLGCGFHKAGLLVSLVPAMMLSASVHSVTQSINHLPLTQKRLLKSLSSFTAQLLKRAGLNDSVLIHRKNLVLSSIFGYSGCKAGRGMLEKSIWKQYWVLP